MCLIINGEMVCVLLSDLLWRFGAIMMCGCIYFCLSDTMIMFKFILCMFTCLHKVEKKNRTWRLFHFFSAFAAEHTWINKVGYYLCETRSSNAMSVLMVCEHFEWIIPPNRQFTSCFTPQLGGRIRRKRTRWWRTDNIYKGNLNCVSILCYCTVCFLIIKTVDLHVEGRYTFLPIFWEDRYVPSNIWAKLFTLRLQWSHIRSVTYNSHLSTRWLIQAW